MEVLRSHGAELQSSSNRGTTAIQIAELEGHWGTVQWLHESMSTWARCWQQLLRPCRCCRRRCRRGHNYVSTSTAEDGNAATIDLAGT